MACRLVTFHTSCMLYLSSVEYGPGKIAQNQKLHLIELEQFDKCCR